MIASASVENIDAWGFVLNYCFKFVEGTKSANLVLTEDLFLEASVKTE